MIVCYYKIHKTCFYLGIEILIFVPVLFDLKLTEPLICLVRSVIFNKPKQFPFSIILSTSNPFPLSFISAYTNFASSVIVIFPANASECFIMLVVVSWIILYNCNSTAEFNDWLYSISEVNKKLCWF